LSAVPAPTSAPTPTFRLATAADAACIGVLGSQVFLDTYAPHGVRPVLAAEVLEHFSTAAIAQLLARADTFFVLAECEAHLVGFAHVSTGADHALVGDRNAAELRRLSVQARFTGRGLGRALLAQAEGFAASHGATALWLHTWIGNTRAIAFYPRCGYVERGVTTYDFQGDLYENRLFSRALAPSRRALP
jgi:GNAT superfamily N-acetyltransferase